MNSIENRAGSSTTYPAAILSISYNSFPSKELRIRTVFVQPEQAKSKVERLFIETISLALEISDGIELEPLNGTSPETNNKRERGAAEDTRPNNDKSDAAARP